MEQANTYASRREELRCPEDESLEALIPDSETLSKQNVAIRPADAQRLINRARPILSIPRKGLGCEVVEDTDHNYVVEALVIERQIQSGAIAPMWDPTPLLISWFTGCPFSRTCQKPRAYFLCSAGRVFPTCGEILFLWRAPTTRPTELANLICVFT